VRLHDLYPAGSEAPACSAVGVFGPLCLQVGSLMAAEALKLVTGIGRPLIGRVALIDALAGTQREAPLRADGETPSASRRDPDAGAATPVRPSVPEVDDPGDAIVIDVREAHELESGTVPGSRHRPLDALLNDIDGVRRDVGGSTVVVVCQVGARARVAARALRSAGVDAAVLRGGMDGWTSRRQAVR
jgi:adenylyltransferase/sulfurtransferase